MVFLQTIFTEKICCRKTFFQPIFQHIKNKSMYMQLTSYDLT